MAVKRHTQERTDEEKILDAARECVLEVGVTATSLTAVAKRAGVSRMTLYRRWPDARSLVMVEQIAGVFYVALVVARLVGLNAIRHSNR